MVKRNEFFIFDLIIKNIKKLNIIKILYILKLYNFISWKK